MFCSFCFTKLPWLLLSIFKNQLVCCLRLDKKSNTVAKTVAYKRCFLRKKGSGNRPRLESGSSASGSDSRPGANASSSTSGSARRPGSSTFPGAQGSARHPGSSASPVAQGSARRPEASSAPMSRRSSSASEDFNGSSTEPHANTGSEIRPQLECSRLELEIKNAVRRDECSRVHSLKTLAFLACTGWPRSKETKPDPKLASATPTNKPHFRVREPQPNLAKNSKCGCTQWCPY